MGPHEDFIPAPTTDPTDSTHARLAYAFTHMHALTPPQAYFLLDRNGELVKRYAAGSDLLSPAILKDIEQLLKSRSHSHTDL